MRYSLILVIIGFAQAIAAAELEVLAIEYPPYTTRQQSDHGVAFRLLDQYLSEQPQLEVRPLFLPPARAQLRLKGESWCASFYPPQDTVASRFVALSQTPVRIGLYHRRDDPDYDWQSLQELKGYRVALLRNQRNSAFTAQFLAAGLELVFVDSVIQGLKMLQKERVDAALGDEHLQEYLSQQLEHELQVRFSSTSLITTPIGIHLNPKCPLAGFFP